MESATFASMGEKLAKEKERGDTVSFEDLCPKRTWFDSVCKKAAEADYRSAGEGAKQGSGKLTGWVFRSDLDALASSSASNIFGQLGSIFCQEFVKGMSEGMQKGMSKLLASKGGGPDTGAKILDQMLAAQAQRSSVRI
jgi:hypothetical protein